MILEPDILNKIYQKWYYGNKPLPRWPTNYNRGQRRDQNFENWLWQQGFTVVQKDKQRYLRFIGQEKNLTLFLLTYGGQ